MKQSTLGARIREIREKRNLALRELARRAGVSPSYLSEIESGRRSPSETVLEALAGELGVNPKELRDLHMGKIMGELKDLMESDPAWIPVLGQLAKAAGRRKLTSGLVSEWMDRI